MAILMHLRTFTIYNCKHLTNHVKAMLIHLRTFTIYNCKPLKNQVMAMLIYLRTFTIYNCKPLKNQTIFFKVLKYVDNCYNYFNSVNCDILRAPSSLRLLRLHIINIIIIIICVNDFKVKSDKTNACFGLEREIMCWQQSIRRMFADEIALCQLWSSIGCFCFSFQLQVIIMLVPNMLLMHHRRQPYLYHSHNIIFFQDYHRLFKIVYLFKEKAIMVSSLNEVNLLYILVCRKCDPQIKAKINKFKIILRDNVNKTYSWFALLLAFWPFAFVGTITNGNLIHLLCPREVGGI